MNPFSTKGRISNIEFIWNAAITGLTYILIIFISVFLAEELQLQTKVFAYLGYTLAVLGFIFFLISMTTLTVRRFQDMNKPGYTIVFMLIPIYNLYLFILLISRIGYGRNIYGPDIISTEINHKAYLKKLVIIIAAFVIYIIGFSLYNKTTIKAYMQNPQINDLYILETEPTNNCTIQIYRINLIQDNTIYFEISAYKYGNVSHAKNAIDKKIIHQIGYYNGYDFIEKDSLKSKKIIKILRHYE